jgi:hypothetical protein
MVLLMSETLRPPLLQSGPEELPISSGVQLVEPVANCSPQAATPAFERTRWWELRRTSRREITRLLNNGRI